MTDTRTSVPGEPAGPRTKGWFRSPGGVLTHADGPSQARACVDRGYSDVDDETAAREIGEGLTLTVSRTDSGGTFDAAAVARAVADESTSTHAKRSAAARKGAQTKAANKAAAEQAARDAANAESDAVTPEG